MFTISALIILIVIALGVWFWQAASRSRELAIVIAKKICNEHNLQFLDGTVAYKSMGFMRHNNGRVGIKRNYSFDYYDGESRLTGQLTLFKNSLIHFKLQPSVSAPIHAANVSFSIKDSQKLQTNSPEHPPTNDNVIPFPLERRKKK